MAASSRYPAGPWQVNLALLPEPPGRRRFAGESPRLDQSGLRYHFGQLRIKHWNAGLQRNPIEPDSQYDRKNQHNNLFALDLSIHQSPSPVSEYSVESCQLFWHTLENSRFAGVHPAPNIDHGHKVLAVVASQLSRRLPRPVSVSNCCLYLHVNPYLYFCLYFCSCHRRC